MRLKKTPELIDALHPLFDAADTVCYHATVYKDSHNPMDKDSLDRSILYVFDHHADILYENFPLRAIKTLIAQLRSAALDTDQVTISVLADAWDVKEHPWITELINLDDDVTFAEEVLAHLREDRARLTKKILKSGVSQYRIAEALNRRQSSVASWVKHVE